MAQAGGLEDENEEEGLNGAVEGTQLEDEEGEEDEESDEKGKGKEKEEVAKNC